MTSAFIIQVHPQLQSDPNAETASLLRVLIYKIDNTTFGGTVPALPQWSGPPRTMVQVEAILYASLATSLFSAFLAMLGKQWLNRYASIDARGSPIERSQNRQLKLNGIVAWYFDHVMESLPLMLQFALLLQGCAFSRYLWGINTIVASVAIGTTSFGVIFYACIIVVGAASLSCPYQTPGANLLRRIRRKFPLVLGALRSAFSPIIDASTSIDMLTIWWDGLKEFEWIIKDVATLLMVTLLLLILLPVCLATDIYLLARTVARVSITLARKMWGWFRGARGSDPRAVELDLQCISWMLQTSLDKGVHLLTLKLLATVMTQVHFKPALISACFGILAGYMSIVGGKAVITQGSDELAAAAALCCLRTLSHLTTMDPTSSVFKEVHRRYTKAIPFETNFEDFPSPHHFSILHRIFYPSGKWVEWRYLRQPRIQWKDYRMSSNEHAALVQLARSEYRRNQRRKVPRWTLRFALHYLSQDPLPPTTVVVDCLLIIAIELGCAVADTTALEKRCVHTLQISTFLTKCQRATGRGFDPDNCETRSHSKGCGPGSNKV